MPKRTRIDYERGFVFPSTRGIRARSKLLCKRFKRAWKDMRVRPTREEWLIALICLVAVLLFLAAFRLVSVIMFYS